uniref:Secapin-3 n=1 Tax=Camponotus floridanus TaxID=104421 RepID=K7NC07_CAMFO|nr:secapin-3 [Camponotus floridanus]
MKLFIKILLSVIFVVNIILLGACQESTEISSSQTTEIPKSIISAPKSIIVVQNRIVCPEGQRNHHGKCREIL